MFWKASGMRLSLFGVLYRNRSSLGKSQQSEVQVKITVFTGSLPSFPRFMDRHRSLQSVKLKSQLGYMKMLVAVKPQNTLSMPGHSHFRTSYCRFSFLSLC